MGRHRESLEAKKMPIREPKGCHKRVKNCVFSGPSRKTRNLTKIHYLLCFRHISHPRKRLFWAFFGIQNRGRNQESTKCPNKCSKMLSGSLQNGTGAENGAQQGCKRASKRNQNDPKIGLGRVPERRYGTKAPQGGLEATPEAKNGAKMA